MLMWLFIIIVAYLLFGLSSFGDKLMLSGRANPKLYTFYIGVLGALIVFAIPFISFGVPSVFTMVWIVLEAIVYLLAIYSMFLALEKFDVSRVMPTIGGLQPIFIVILTWIFWGPSIMQGADFLAFILLLIGSVTISLEKKIKVTRGYLFLTIFSSLMFSLDYVFSKMIFLDQPFLQGLIWMRLVSFVLVIGFLFSKELRSQIFTSLSFSGHSKKSAVHKKTGLIFAFTQLAGGVGGILQSLSISLVPVSYLAIINSLRGIQYVFLFFITLFVSFFLPSILKENITKKVIILKGASILLIVLGLAILL